MGKEKNMGTEIARPDVPNRIKDTEPTLDREQAGPTQPDTLAAALLRAQRDIEAIGRDAQSGGSDSRYSFKYVSADEMTAHCRSALLKQGLAYSMLSCVEVSAARSTHQVWNKDAKAFAEMPVWLVQCEHSLVHAASGEERRWLTTFPAVAGNGRPIDKASAGAMTVASREALRYLLCVPRVDENEIEKRDDDDYGRPPPSQRPAARPSAPAAAPKSAAAPEREPEQRTTTAAAGPRPNWQASKWPPSGVQETVGTLEQVSAKSGTTNGKQWTRYGVRVGEDWFNTFDATAAQVAEANRGGSVKVEWAQGKGTSRDLLSIAPDEIPF